MLDSMTAVATASTKVADPQALRGWRVICLRPRPQQAAAAAIIHRWGAAELALPALRLQPVEDPGAARRHLVSGLVAGLAVFTSVPAARHALQLLPDLRLRLQQAFAVGEATAAILADAGVAAVQAPTQATSEGLLALPGLQRGASRPLALVGAAGGRGLLQPELAARGFDLVRCDVYRRGRARLDRRHWQQLEAAAQPLALLLTSLEAFDSLLQQAPPTGLARLRGSRCVCSSGRLLDAANERGMSDVLLSPGPSIEQQLSTLADATRACSPPRRDSTATGACRAGGRD